MMKIDIKFKIKKDKVLYRISNQNLQQIDNNEKMCTGQFFRGTYA